MDETIIIYTKYFSEAVIEVLDQYDLNIQILCFSSYDAVLAHMKITPNLRGLIMIEHKPRAKTFKAYKTIVATADEIAESSKLPFCISIISNSEYPRKFFTKITSKHIEILYTKFVMFNTDLLKFEGISAVILNTIGIGRNSILQELDKEDEGTRVNAQKSKMEFWKYCLQIATVELETLEELRYAVARFPELEKLFIARTLDTKDAEYLNSPESVFKRFLVQAIERRKEDESKNTYNH